MMAVSSVQHDSGFVDNWQSGKSLAECNLYMLTFEDSCDVSFRVGKYKKMVRAHRFVLISRSCVFHAMLCGPLAEKDDITLTDVEPEIFTELLRYLYTNTSAPNPENVTSLLYLAKKYAVGGLEHLCLTYLKSSLSAENACVILEQAHVYDETELYDRAMEVILDNGEKCLRSKGFKQMGPKCFHKVVSSDALRVKAEGIYTAALSWAEETCTSQGREITPATLRSVLDDTLYSIPFMDMDQKYYVEEVLPRQILTDAENVIIMALHVCPERNSSPFRKRRNTMLDVHGTPRVSILKSTNVIFFDHLKKTLNHIGNVSGSVSFTCNDNVHLLGIYVFGSATDTNNNYKLKVGRHVSVSVLECCYPDWFLKGNYLSHSTSKVEQCIRAIFVKAPLHIAKGLKHIINISQVGEGLPKYVGDTVSLTIDADSQRFSGVTSNGAMDIIYGLIL